MEITQKTISLSIIGKPNAGKSSLLNKLIGQKISIVTNKVQTTRSIITGIVTIKDTQLIILDTPGIFEPKKQLEKAMVRCAWSSLHGVDLVLLIIDSTKPMDQFTLQILKKLQTLRINLIFLLNKIDSPSEYLEEIENTLRCQFIDNYILRVSVLSGENINKLLNYIQSQAKQSPWLYEEDDVTNLPMRFLAAEITREQLFLNLHQELPYNLTVQTEMWQENNRPLRKLAYAKEFEGDAERRTAAYSNVREDSSTASTYKLPAEVEFPERYNDKSIKIHQVIVVSRDSYKTIILGKNGCKIKEIGSKARIEMQKAFDCKIHLFLFVKVRELWQNDPNSYSHMRLQQAQI